MKNINILTFSALMLLPFAVFQSYHNYHLAAELTATVALIFAVIDNQKITSRFQHISLPIIAAVLAVIMERSIGGFPYAGISMLFFTAGLITRMVFIKIFAYARFRYFELMTLMAAMALVGIKLWLFPEKWLYLFPAYISIVILMMHTHIIIKNAFMLQKGASKGYKASPGTKAPDFLLPDQYGNGIRLSDFRGKRHVLLIFVRGDWCPYCHMIMRTYMNESHRFEEKNIILMAIGPDPAGINREMAKKLGIDYIILSDEKMKVAQEYGIRLPDFELMGATEHDEGMPLPASFLVDKEGTVVFTSRSDRVGEFLNPKRIFPIVENLK